MLLVNNPGDFDAVYSQLRHSAWHGCTIADLVFPSFLFVVGITTAMAAQRDAERGGTGQGRIWRRAGWIFAIGLLLNWYPFYQSGSIVGSQHPGFFDRVVARLLVVRIPGVLQRIAVAYLAAALIARRASSRAITLITAALLLGYWALLTIVPVPGEGVLGVAVLDQPSRTIVAHVDRAAFDWTRWELGNHLWDTARTWDPEGILSTIPAIATVLIGVLCARWMAHRELTARWRGLLGGGAARVAAGLVWSLVFPLNKPLWSSSYVLYSAGIAMLALGALSAALDRGGEARWARPLIVFGENPLVAYAGSELAHMIFHSSIKLKLDGRRLGLDEWTSRVLANAGLSPDAASLAWALLFLGFWLFVLSRLSRRGLFVRV